MGSTNKRLRQRTWRAKRMPKTGLAQSQTHFCWLTYTHTHTQCNGCLHKPTRLIGNTIYIYPPCTPAPSPSLPFPPATPTNNKERCDCFYRRIAFELCALSASSCFFHPCLLHLLILGSAPFPWPNVHRLVRSHESYASTGAIWCQAEERRISAQSIEQVRTSISQVCACSPAFVLGLWHCPLPQFGSTYLRLSQFLLLFCVLICCCCVGNAITKRSPNYRDLQWE